jgi:hypothetical protein
MVKMKKSYRIHKIGMHSSILIYAKKKNRLKIVRNIDFKKTLYIWNMNSQLYLFM